MSQFNPPRMFLLPHVDAVIFPLGCDFLFPYLGSYARFCDQMEDADFVLAMNNTSPDALERLSQARRCGQPVAWWTIEDPNSFETFLPQAAQADFVFTTDEACVPHYEETLGHSRVFWLPLACSPQYHYPLSLALDATDFVLSANWYANQARQWSAATIVDPLIQAGHSLTIFSYANFLWPEPYRRYWKGETSCRTVAEQYRQGKVVLGVNNQRSGLDGIANTVMTSMRTFEALACGKPLLTAYSDAFARLGFLQGEHLAWAETPDEASVWAARLLGEEGRSIAMRGRAYVLSNHTYAHRLAKIAEAVFG